METEYIQPKRKILGVRLSAIWEILIFLFVLTVFNYLFGDGNRFISYDLHPFWIIILLTSCLYGAPEGLLAALCCTFVLYFRNIPEIQADQSLFDYEVSLGFLPLLWFITAFILGEIRSNLNERERRTNEKMLHADSKADRIAAEYSSLKEQNEQLALSLTSREETAASAFQVFQAMEALDPGLVIMGLNPIIEMSLKPEKFSVYAKGPNGLEAVTSKGWVAEDNFQRRYKPDTPLYNAIVEQKKLVSVINKDDQHYLQNEGILAAPLIDEDSQEVFGMIKVEAMQFQNLNLIRIETFKTVCRLIGRAYANSKKHKELFAASIYTPLGLFSNSLYKRDLKCLQNLGEKWGFSISELNLKHVGTEEIEKAVLELKSFLPNEAFVYQGSRKQDFLVLIPTVEGENVDSCINALRATGKTSSFSINGKIYEKA